jgi:hypothetical protein
MSNALEVWSVNQALRESNQKLELEVATLRQAAGVRRLSACGAGGRSYSSAGEGGHGTHSSTAFGASQQALQLAGLEQQLRDLQRAAAAEREAAGERLQAAQEAAVAQAAIAELSLRLRMAQDQAHDLRSQLEAAHTKLAVQQVQLSTQQGQLANVTGEARATEPRRWPCRSSWRQRRQPRLSRLAQRPPEFWHWNSG